MTAPALDVEEAFRSALERDADLPPADIPAPPRKSVIVDPDAPHGRAGNGEPNAPFGLNKKTGKPNLRKPGKPPKDDAPRVQASSASPAPGTSPAAQRDYTQAVSDLTDGVWMLMSSAPVPLPALKVRIQAQAALISGNKPGIVKGVSLIAANNDPVAKGIDRLTSGGASWILPAMFALGPLVAQSVQVWRSPAEAITPLAASNEAAWDGTVKAMMAAAEAQADE